MKFEKESKIKSKTNIFNYAVRENEYQTIIIITYDECIFSANDRV